MVCWLSGPAALSAAAQARAGGFAARVCREEGTGGENRSFLRQKSGQVPVGKSQAGAKGRGFRLPRAGGVSGAVA